MSNFDKAPSFKTHDLNQVITQYAVLLIGDDGEDELKAWGTAFFVAPGFAITAKHVITGFWEAIEEKPKLETDIPIKTNFTVLALQDTGDGTLSAAWLVKNAWCSKFTDIAFLDLQPANEEASNYQWRGRLQLSMLPPGIGERIFAFGYPTSGAVAVTRSPYLKVNWGLNPSTTVGEVIEIYEEYRDRVMLNFPCFQINARFDGGMSGGPVFNQEGQICGVICASLDAPTEEGYVSYVASLWAAMPTMIDYQGEGFIVKGNYGVFELFGIGFLKQVGWEDIFGRIILERDENGFEWLSLRSMEEFRK
jgi:S1-C subfamily serine protease